MKPVCALISGLRAAAMRRLASETPRCGSVCETEQLGPLNVWGASLHSVQGAASLVPLCGYPLKAKGVKSHAFCLFYCLTNTARTRVSFLFAVQPQASSSIAVITACQRAAASEYRDSLSFAPKIPTKTCLSSHRKAESRQKPARLV